MGGVVLINGSARTERQIERGLRRALGRRKLCPSPVSGTLLLNVLSHNRRFLHFLSLNKGTHSTYSVYRA